MIGSVKEQLDPTKAHGKNHLDLDRRFQVV